MTQPNLSQNPVMLQLQAKVAGLQAETHMLRKVVDRLRSTRNRHFADLRRCQEKLWKYEVEEGKESAK